MATKVKKQKHMSISMTLFGVPRERGDELAEIVEDTMADHAVNEQGDSSSQEIADHWKTMFGDMIVHGKTENERLWITFSFSSRYARYVDEYMQRNNVMQAFKKLLGG